MKTAFSSVEAVHKAMLTKLNTSSLTAQDAKVLCFEPRTAEQCAQQYPKLPMHRAGFKIPYFDLTGKPTDFFRYRYLEYGTDAGFASLVTTNGNGQGTALKLLRYGQSAGSKSEVYFPPLAGMDWQEVLEDPAKPLIITEGEIKAASALKFGVPTIGIGGVWMWRSAAEGLHLLPQLKAIKWKGRTVYLCYDSDAETNPNVALAENALSRELCQLGAKPAVCRLPPIVLNGKTGLDDYLVMRGPEEFAKKILGRATDWEGAQELFQMNTEVVYIKDPGLVLETATMQRMSPKAFVDHVYAPRKYHQQEITANGGTDRKSVPAAREWIKWEARSMAKKLTYSPGLPLITADEELNLWKGWGCQATPSTVEPWHQLTDYLFKYE